MENLVAAIILTLNTLPTGVQIPANEDPITWVFAECRATNALTTEFGMQDAYKNEGYKKFDQWSTNFFDLLGGFDIDLYELTSVGDTRSRAMAKVAKDKILGILTEENIDSRLMACGVSYEAMSLSIVEHL